MRIPVVIHTRDRLDNLRKVIPSWLAQDVHRILLMIEPTEYFQTRRFLKEQGWDSDVEIIRLSQKNAGMGNARATAVQWVHRGGYEVMYMSDDDIMPKKGVSVAPLADWVLSGDAVGCGVSVPFYGIQLGNAFLRDTNIPVPTSGSWGYRLFALNVGMAMDAGNFDRRLDVGWEDHELCRAGIKAFHVPWYIHTGVSAASIDARYAPGGIASLCDLEDRKRREKRCHTYIYKKWGVHYISNPEKRYRCNWTRLLNDHGIDIYDMGCPRRP